MHLLPPELIFLIVDFIKDDWAALKAASLTCSWLRVPSQSLLLRRLTLDYSCLIREIDGPLGPSTVAPHQVVLIKANPYITEVEIKSSIWYKKDQDSVIAALTQLEMSRIRRLTLDFGGSCEYPGGRLQPTAELYFLLFRLCQSPSLVDVRLNHAPYDIIRHFQPSVKHLEIECPRSCYDRFRFSSSRVVNAGAFPDGGVFGDPQSRLPVELRTLVCASNVVGCVGALDTSTLLKYVMDPRSIIDLSCLQKLSISLTTEDDFRCMPALLDRCQAHLQELNVSIKGAFKFKRSYCVALRNQHQLTSLSFTGDERLWKNVAWLSDVLHTLPIPNRLESLRLSVTFGTEPVGFVARWRGWIALAARMHQQQRKFKRLRAVKMELRTYPHYLASQIQREVVLREIRRFMKPLVERGIVSVAWR